MPLPHPPVFARSSPGRCSRPRYGDGGAIAAFVTALGDTYAALERGEVPSGGLDGDGGWGVDVEVFFTTRRAGAVGRSIFHHKTMTMTKHFSFRPEVDTQFALLAQIVVQTLDSKKEDQTKMPQLWMVKPLCLHH